MKKLFSIIGITSALVLGMGVSQAVTAPVPIDFLAAQYYVSGINNGDFFASYASGWTVKAGTLRLKVCVVFRDTRPLRTKWHPIGCSTSKPFVTYHTFYGPTAPCKKDRIFRASAIGFFRPPQHGGSVQRGPKVWTPIFDGRCT